jgi:hypothetical protein
MLLLLLLLLPPAHSTAGASDCCSSWLSRSSCRFPLLVLLAPLDHLHVGLRVPRSSSFE